MELLGSIHALSGSMSASVFTGSFKGDASGLYNIPASGVTGLNLSQIATGSVTASVSLDGFNVNSDTSITGSLTISGTVVSQTTTLVSGSPQIDITNTTNYTSFSSSIATTDLNQENRLSALETSSGSLNSFTSSIDTTIKNKLNTENVVSGSAQILSNSGIVSSSTQVTEYGFATTGSNTFIGTQTLSGSIIPSIDNTYDLGSPTYQWRDVYISSGSLYVDGTKVLSSTAQELLITTDTGQSIKILEGTTDSIILQTADGDIELKSSADGDILLDPTNGKIMLKGPVEILNGNKIQSSVGGTPVVFANDIVVSGSIDITGTIEGIDLTNFSSSLNNRISTLETSAGSLNSFTSSTNNRLDAIETSTGSLNSFTNSINTTIKSKLDSEGVISGSVQVDITNTTNYTTFSSSISSSIGDLSGSIATTTNNLSTSVATYNLGQDNRLNSIEGKTGSYATTGSNNFIGDQTITGSLVITQQLTVLGSSSILYVTTSQLAVSSSTISVNIFEPAERFGGLKVYDSGSLSHQATASLLWDSLNNHWIYQNASGSNYSGGMLLSGPRNTGSLGDEIGLTSGKLARSVGGDHLDNSIVTQVGGDSIGISGSLVVTGSILSTGTSLVSGSSQIDHNSTTNYVGTEHIDHANISVDAGSGLTGGGTINFSRTISLDTTSTHFTTGVKTKLNTEGVISGSSQVSFNGISGKPALVSGSSQITYSGLSGIPSGIVSGSSQITYGSISSIPSGIVSGSAQIDLTSTTNYSSGIKTRLNAEGVLSGSAQVVSSLPSGTVSGSVQITLSSTTGYATYDATVVHLSGNETITGIKTFENSSTDQIIIKSTGAGTTDVGAVITMQGSDGSSNRTFAYISALKENSTSGNYASRLVFYTRANGAGLAEALSLASNKNATFGGSINGLVVSSGTITTGTWNGTAIANAYLANSSFYVGTTSISLGRASASQTLTGVSIDGNAATATSASSATNSTNSGYLGSADLRTISPNSHDAYKMKFGFTSWANNNSAPYADYLHLRSYSDGSGGSDNLVMFLKSGIGMRIYQQTFGSSTAYSSYADVLHSSNYSSYTLPLAGGTLTGQLSVSTNSIGMDWWKDGSGTYMEFYGTSTATRKLRLQGSDGTNYAQWFIDGGNQQIYGTVASNTNLLMNSSAVYLRYNGSDKFYTGSDGTRNVGWLYFQTSGNGIHYPGHNSHFYQPSTGAYWHMNPTESSSYGGLILYSNYNSTMGGSSYRKGYLYYDTNGFGLLGGGDGAWAININTATAKYVTIGGDASANAYNTNTGVRLMFGGGNSDAQGNYYIGTNFENYGGNYNKLDLRWHTGIRMGAQQGYGGIRFFNNEDLDSVLFSIGAGDANVRSHTNLIPSANNSYNLGASGQAWANVYTNDLHLSNEGKEGGNDVDGTTGDWTIQEGEENLYIINNKNGKKFKIDLTEIV